MCQTQSLWVQLLIKPKCVWVWQDVKHVKPNILRFSYVLSPNAYKFDNTFNFLRFSYALNSYACGASKMLDSISYGSIMCWAWVHVSFTRCQTQHYWVQPLVVPECVWVCQGAKPITFEFGILSNPIHTKLIIF